MYAYAIFIGAIGKIPIAQFDSNLTGFGYITVKTEDHFEFVVSITEDILMKDLLADESQILSFLMKIGHESVAACEGHYMAMQESYSMIKQEKRKTRRVQRTAMKLARMHASQTGLLVDLRRTNTDLSNRLETQRAMSSSVLSAIRGKPSVCRKLFQD